jgi:hypothetical protein
LSKVTQPQGVEQAVERAPPNSDVLVHVEAGRRGLTPRDRLLAITPSEPAVDPRQAAMIATP